MSPKKCRIESLEGLEEVELLALRPRKNSLRCRLLGTDEEITFRTNSPSLIAPGEILTIHIHKTWTYAGHPYLSGEILHRRIDPKALDLPPLKLQDMGLWDPAENWSDLEDESGEAPDWMKELTCRGPRQAYEMESVLPGMNPEDFDSDPILEAIELADMGHPDKAEDALYRVLEADLRCLDAHAHLGNFDFEWLPAAALSHYQVGAAIGWYSLPPDFDGYLPWGFIENRPFLRCLKGMGLCLWRLERGEESQEVFERILRFNPDDNQGVRFLLPYLRNGVRWEDLPSEK